jgi:Zn-dependent protease with chaperone function
LLLAFWFGGLGLLLLGRSWAQFWRQRDFLADDYAYSIGQDDNLMAVLEIYRHVDVAQPYLLTNRPYTAERLDRLKG